MKETVNIPNAMSIARLLSIPFIMVLILDNTPGTYPVLLVVYLFSLALDFFDGYLARKLGQETRLGKILDPLSDKSMIFATVLALVIKTRFPLWLALTIVLRDVAILLASVLMIKRLHEIKSSILVGKVTFAVLGALMMAYIIDLHEGIDLEICKRFFAILTLAFISWSILGYYRLYRRAGSA